MSEKVVKTGFLMPVSYSRRAKKIASVNGMSMRALLVEAIGIGLQSLEDSMVPTSSSESVSMQDSTNGIASSSEVATLFTNLAEIAKLSIDTATEVSTAAQPPRHKPTKPKSSTWRFR